MRWQEWDNFYMRMKQKWKEIKQQQQQQQQQQQPQTPPVLVQRSTSARSAPVTPKNFLEREAEVVLESSSALMKAFVQNQLPEEGNSTLDLRREIRLWASYRAQTVARTMRGAVEYHKALELLLGLEEIEEIEEIARSRDRCKELEKVLCAT